MCGLVGLVGPGINQVDLGAFYTLSYISGLRGLHSTGICQGNKFWRNEVQYVVERGTFNVGEFFEYHSSHPDGNKNVGNDVTDNFMLMHLRHATRGLITPDNAHPFDLDNIVGMHNGTLTDEKYQSADKTDSELLFRDIDANGIIPVLRPLSLGSAYALVMMDKRSGEINIVRNSKRTLFYCYHRNRNVMYYASEAMFLEFMAKRHNLDIGPIRAFEPETVYTISPDDVKREGQTRWTCEPLFQRGVFLLQDQTQGTTHSNQTTTPATSPNPKAAKPKGKHKGGKPKPIGDDGKVIDIGAARTVVEEIAEARKKRLGHSNTQATGFEGGPTPATFADIAREPWTTESGVCVYPRAIPITKCIYCHKKLDLYEKYKATMIQTGMYSCADCEKQQYDSYINSEVKVN